MSSTKSLEELKKLWKEFSEVPINDDDTIERAFHGFEAGTDRFEIWHWFDDKCPNGLKRDLIDAEEHVEDQLWVVCEAYEQQTDNHGIYIHNSLDAWAEVYACYESALKSLRHCIRARVEENYEGLDDDEVIESDIAEVLDAGHRIDTQLWEYRYHCSDRDIVWRLFSTTAKGKKQWEKGRKQRHCQTKQPNQTKVKRHTKYVRQ